ncbi:hypothetical protein PIB30_026116 [Stylosanthes scabra]|uniref:Uncharacterized protein n=1 Tax=Stylosanthes scabra TaxID=79078 RepID=A0ABU6TB29_9FABA|nr:hypothetical protein [Stylosanthes scabra]
MADVKARNRSSRNKKKGLSGGILKVKSLLKKLQKVVLLLVGKNNKPSSSSSSISIADDVKKGHFAVIAVEEGPKRFLVPLSCLKSPTFLSLLERAAEEYGFDQHGAITIPCNPSDLETLLAHHQQEQEEDDKS